MSLSSGKEPLEILTDFLSTCAKYVLGLGSVATLVAITFLVFTIERVTSGAATGVSAADAINNVHTFEKILNVGLLGVLVGSTYLFWGEEILGALQLLFAGILWFAPVYLPMIFGEGTNEVASHAYDALQSGGVFFGAIALTVTLVDIVIRIRNRAKHGIKADHLRYGKGIKEDVDRQNVFMGKCWQLPFCRKFVRERCPIYHSKRTCWKERTGCMCEEEVIRNAMENKPIPKDALLAANMIPRNHRLTEAQKAERCRNCVIYNEHQKHKYKLLLPATLVFFCVFYAIFRGPLLSATAGLVEATDRVIQAGTMGGISHLRSPDAFIEGLLITFMVVALSYALKILEFLVFKLKV